MDTIDLCSVLTRNDSEATLTGTLWESNKSNRDNILKQHNLAFSMLNRDLSVRGYLCSCVPGFGVPAILMCKLLLSTHIAYAYQDGLCFRCFPHLSLATQGLNSLLGCKAIGCSP